MSLLWSNHIAPPLFPYIHSKSLMPDLSFHTLPSKGERSKPAPIASSSLRLASASILSFLGSFKNIRRVIDQTIMSQGQNCGITESFGLKKTLKIIEYPPCNQSHKQMVQEQKEQERQIQHFCLVISASRYFQLRKFNIISLWYSVLSMVCVLPWLNTEEKFQKFYHCY